MEQATAIRFDISREVNASGLSENALATSSEVRRTLVTCAIPVFGILIFGLPLLAVFSGLAAARPVPMLEMFLLIASPILYVSLFLLVSGLLSIPFQWSIREGKFQRDLGDRLYGARRLYGFCWTCVYYFSPVYHLILSIPALKKSTFWLFGYRGSHAFTVYPDTWLRDLPLLKIEDGAYLSNKCTIGTNMCTQDGRIIVGAVHIKKGALIGHLSMIAPGVTVGEGSEISVGCAIGLRVQIGSDVVVGPTTTVNHFAVIGDHTEIGTMSYIGAGARIGSNLRIPAGSLIPNRARVSTQDDVKKYVSSLTEAPDDLFQNRNSSLRGSAFSSSILRMSEAA